MFLGVDKVTIFWSGGHRSLYPVEEARERGTQEGYGDEAMTRRPPLPSSAPFAYS
jgi:hypothetical protein